MIDKKALWESIKEPLRWLALGFIPFAVSYFTEIEYGWAGVAVVVLRVVDSYLHQQAPKGVSGGIVHF